MIEDYWYDEAAADFAVEFFPKYLRFTEGEWAGQPFKLEQWQADDIVRPLFGWKREDGTRRYRRCIVWVPRKNGKTELAAGIALLCLIGDGEWGGQGYSIATVEDQARIVFNKASTMVGFSEELQAHLEAYTTSVFCPELNASFKPLSKSPSGKHGLSTSFLVGDEVHEWTDDRLYTFLHQSTGARRQPLEFLISTAGVRQGYGWELWDTCQKVREGVIDDPELLLVVYAADEEDDWTDEATWIKANPNLGVSLKWDYIRSEFRAALESPRRENDFKRYHLDLWTEQLTRWIQMEKWDACSQADRRSPIWQDIEQQMGGRECWGGVDLSSTTDMTALIWVFPPDDVFEKWHAIARYWVPEDNVAQRIKRDRQPYDLWTASGALQTTPGNVVDYAGLKEQIYADMEQFRVNGVGFDPWNATQVMVDLLGEGVPVEKFRQGYASMTAPSKEFERLVIGGLIEHGQHPVLRWNVANVAISQDPAGNIKPDKHKSTERIDGVVGLIEGIGLQMADETTTSVYEERGLVVI